MGESTFTVIVPTNPFLPSFFLLIQTFPHQTQSFAPVAQLSATSINLLSRVSIEGSCEIREGTFQWIVSNHHPDYRILASLRIVVIALQQVFRIDVLLIHIHLG